MGRGDVRWRVRLQPGRGCAGQGCCVSCLTGCTSCVVVARVMRRLSRRSPSPTYCSRSYGARQTCTVVSLLPDTMWLPLGNQATLAQASGAGTTPFAIRVPYASSFQGGTQEATIVLYSYTGNHVIAGAVMVKVLLSTS